MPACSYQSNLGPRNHYRHQYLSEFYTLLQLTGRRPSEYPTTYTRQPEDGANAFQTFFFKDHASVYAAITTPYPIATLPVNVNNFNVICLYYPEAAIR